MTCTCKKSKSKQTKKRVLLRQAKRTKSCNFSRNKLKYETHIHTFLMPLFMFLFVSSSSILHGPLSSYFDFVKILFVCLLNKKLHACVSLIHTVEHVCFSSLFCWRVAQIMKYIQMHKKFFGYMNYKPWFPFFFDSTRNIQVYIGRASCNLKCSKI